MFTRVVGEQFFIHVTSGVARNASKPGRSKTVVGAKDPHLGNERRKRVLLLVAASNVREATAWMSRNT